MNYLADANHYPESTIHLRFLYWYFWDLVVEYERLPTSTYGF